MEINNPKQKRDKRARARAPVALRGFCFVFSRQEFQPVYGFRTVSRGVDSVLDAAAYC